MNSTLIKAENLSVKYQRGLIRPFVHTALDDVSLTIKAGDTLGILGKNGSGKSSLLRVLAGIIKPSSGRVLVTPGIKRVMLSIGLGFRNDLSGRDNAMLSLMLQGTRRSSAKGTLNKIHEFSEIGDYFDQPLKTYSTGMRARLGFATAIMTQLDVMFIDETLAVGDQEFKAKAQQALLDKMSRGTATVIVSHDVKQLKKVCNHAVWLKDTRLVQAGPINDVVQQYELMQQ